MNRIENSCEYIDTVLNMVSHIDTYEIDRALEKVRQINTELRARMKTAESDLETAEDGIVELENENAELKETIKQLKEELGL